MCFSLQNRGWGSSVKTSSISLRCVPCFHPRLSSSPRRACSACIHSWRPVAIPLYLELKLSTLCMLLQNRPVVGVDLCASVCICIYLVLRVAVGLSCGQPHLKTDWTSEDRTHRELVSGNFCHHDHASSGQPRYLQPFSAHRQGGYSQSPLVHQLVITLIMAYNVDLWKK